MCESNESALPAGINSFRAARPSGSTQFHVFASSVEYESDSVASSSEPDGHDEYESDEYEYDVWPPFLSHFSLQVIRDGHNGTHLKITVICSYIN